MPHVAVLGHGVPEAARLADALGAALVDTAPVTLAERVLRRRGFTGPLTHLPAATLALRRGAFDVVHAFSAPDAAAARLWRRATGGPVVFTCAETLDRGNVSDRRLRLRLLDGALQDSDAVIAAGEPQRDALWRWAAVDVEVLAPDDVDGHARLYRNLLAARR